MGKDMININGKEWAQLESPDIHAAISEQDFEESFYFELKDDRVAGKKLMEEVSAFSNTFGGYIIIGVSDDKHIEGCTTWNEQKIHTTIHDSITPTPSFDVKKFTIGESIIYVIKVDEGSEPPYITSSGKIYERLSSGSFVIRDSLKLSQIYSKREQLLAKMEKRISIPPVDENVNNICGYIDMGFTMVTSDFQVALDAFNGAALKDVAQKLATDISEFNFAYVGNSIVYLHGGVSTTKGHLPAHTNNFLEIMADGSARMRILLINNNPEDSSINMVFPLAILNSYKKVYAAVMGSLFPHKMAYAKKYEMLEVRKQFQPVVFYNDSILELHPDWKEDNDKMLDSIQKHREIFGVTTIVTNDRIPKTGLYTIDRRQLELWGQEYTAESIINELFFSRYAELGFFPAPQDDI